MKKPERPRVFRLFHWLFINSAGASDRDAPACAGASGGLAYGASAEQASHGASAALALRDA
jgi:hypothetical protein